MAPPPKKRPPTIPGQVADVSRIEHNNLESVVRANAKQLERLHTRMDDLSREIAELAKAVRRLRSET